MQSLAQRCCSLLSLMDQHPLSPTRMDRSHAPSRPNRPFDRRSHHILSGHNKRYLSISLSDTLPHLDDLLSPLKSDPPDILEELRLSCSRGQPIHFYLPFKN